MRKLLVLSLVLGIASLASAGYSIAGYDGSDILVGSTTFDLQIVASEVGAAEYAYGVLVVNELGSLDAGTAGAGAGNLGGLGGGVFKDFFPAANGKEGFDWSASDSGGAVLNGNVIEGITFESLGGGIAVVELWVSSNFVDFVQADVILVFQDDVPEPATMALLGLGGLVLLRRKRLI